jgi:hypothetical protein
MSAAAMATAAEASSMPAAKASHVATAEVSAWRTVVEGIVMPAIVIVVLPVMVVSEIRIVASTIPSIGIRGISIARATIVVIAWFAASTHKA